MVVNAPDNQSSLPKDIYARNINEWMTDIHKALEHLCPYCQQNSVIDDAIGYDPLTEELLERNRECCYEKDKWWEDNDGSVRL